jgi:hypothetical protein
MTFPTPPGVTLEGDKKTSKAGTSKKSSSGSKSDEGGKEKLDPDVDDGFSY